MPDYLEELQKAEQVVDDLVQRKAEFELSGGNGNGEEVGDESSEDERPNYAQEMSDRLRELKASIREQERRIKYLERQASKKSKGKRAQVTSATAPTTNAEELQRLRAEIAPVQTQIAILEEKLAPYLAIKEQLAAARKKYHELSEMFLKRIDEARAALTTQQALELTLEILRDSLSTQLKQYVKSHLDEVIAANEIWWDKYRTTLQELESMRNNHSELTIKVVQELGYAK